MSSRFFLALTAALLLTHLGAAQAPADAVEAELKRLAGKWRVVAAERDGTPAKSDTVAQFIGTKVRLSAPGSGLPPWELTLTLDPSATPPRMDLTNEVGRTQKGIYELMGDTLRVVSQADPAGPRPTELKTAKGDGRVMYTYQRVKAK